MIAKFIYWFTGFLKCRIIDNKGDPYLERYYLCTIFGLRFFIHRFVASDPDRGVHNHPWKWALSFILAGGYDEIRWCTKNNFNYVHTVLRRAPTCNFISGVAMHRILVPKEKCGVTWTLFIHGKRNKPWGFTTYDDINGLVVKHKYHPVNMKKERNQNEHWWNNPNVKTGNEIRNS